MTIVSATKPATQQTPACAGKSINVFYSRSRAQLAVALETCGGCPIRDMCLHEELQRPITHQYGVRGGLTAARRREILRSWRRAGYEMPSSPVRQPIATVEAPSDLRVREVAALVGLSPSRISQLTSRHLLAEVAA